MAKTWISTEHERHEDPGIGDFEPTLTKQEFLQESDVNNIIDSYQTSGLGIAANDAEPIFGDFSAPELRDYHQAMNIVQGSQELFERLPAKVRERFRNDPAELITFVQDPANLEEAHELGLLRPDYNSPSKPPAPPPAPPAS